jgi:hypothetical protein
VTTYGELVTKAARCIHEGSARTQHQRFDTIDDAYAALIGYHAVLDAIERHVRSLVDPHRMGTLYGVPPGLSTGDPIEYAAVQMVASIPVLEDKDRRVPHLPGPNDHPWARAARLLRAGTDLLATHLGPDGRSRTPEATTVTDFAERRVALGRIADVTGALLSGEMTLALRAGQAGITWWRLRRWLPGMDGARAWAERTVAEAGGRCATGALDAVGMAHAPIRNGDAPTQLSDLLRALREAAWTNVREPDRSVVTLRDFALFGLAASASAASVNRDSDPRRFIESAAQWQALLFEGRHLLAPGPGNPAVHAAVPRVHRLTTHLAAAAVSTSRVSGISSRQTGALLNHAVGVAAEIAGWNAQTFKTLAASDQIFIPARELTGDQVTDAPDLVRAKLGGAVVPVPDTIRDAILARYRETCTRESSPLCGTLDAPRSGTSVIVERDVAKR